MIDVKPLESTGGNQIFNPPLVHSLAFTPDGQYIAAGLGDSSIGIIDFKRKTICNRFSWHRAAVCSVQFLSDQNLISIGNDNQIALWKYPEMLSNEIVDCKELVADHITHPNRCNWVDVSEEDRFYVADVSSDISTYQISI